MIVSAGEPREGRLLISDTPLDRTPSDVASFRLPVASPDSFDDVVVLEAGDYDEPSGRSSADIPRDETFGLRAGPRLPLPDHDVLVLEVGDDGEVEQGRGRLAEDGIIRVVDGIPRDVSGPGQAGFRLPLVHTDFTSSPTARAELSEADFDIIEVGVEGEEEAGRSISTKDPADCLKPLARSRCRGSLVQWYYNSQTLTCQTFSYGGCDSDEHSNRFETEEDCRQVCVI